VRRLGLALALALLVPAAPAAALDRYVPMKVPPGPGPAKYDRVFVQQLGPAAARTVLVLVPGPVVLVAGPTVLVLVAGPAVLVLAPCPAVLVLGPAVPAPPKEPRPFPSLPVAQAAPASAPPRRTAPTMGTRRGAGTAIGDGNRHSQVTSLLAACETYGAPSTSRGVRVRTRGTGAAACDRREPGLTPLSRRTPDEEVARRRGTRHRRSRRVQEERRRRFAERRRGQGGAGCVRQARRRPGRADQPAPPKPEDYDAVFVGDAGQKVKTALESVWQGGKAVLRPQPEQTEVQIAGSTPEQLGKADGSTGLCPKGYKDIADKLNPKITIYCAHFVKPGEKLGMVVDGLVYVNGHWALFPKSFKVLNP